MSMKKHSLPNFLCGFDLCACTRLEQLDSELGIAARFWLQARDNDEAHGGSIVDLSGIDCTNATQYPSPKFEQNGSFFSSRTQFFASYGVLRKRSA